MRHNIRTLALVLTVAFMVTLSDVGIRAQSVSEPSVSDSPVLFGLPPGEQPSNTAITIMVELAEQADQTLVSQSLTAIGAEQLYTINLRYRGIAVRLPIQHITNVQQIVGVQTIHIITAKHRLRTREASVAAQLQSLTSNYTATGKNVRIGIIDSGIDYTHATFGGVGTPAAYDAINPAIIDAASFPTAKVAGGFDLAGDNYDADGIVGTSTPTPDPNPLDCAIPNSTITLNRGGHGTHVASIAAGYGVLDGATYRGSYDNLPDSIQFNLTPGVAPEATLYAFKVFGCRGSTVLIASAIAKAIDPNGDGDTSDRLVDILNIAIGSPFAGADDPDAQAVDAAVEAGVTVVLAAGDSGNVFYAGSSPGNATGAVTIGALGLEGLADFSSRSPQPGAQAPKPDLIAPGVAVLGAASGSGIDAVAMDGTSMAAAHAVGAAALVLEMRPFWNPAQIKGSLMSTATPVVDTRGLQYPVSLVGTGVLNIPAVPAAGTVAFAAGLPSSGGIAFDASSLTAPVTVVREISIYNGDAPQVVQLSASTIVSETGVTVTVPDQVELFQCEYTTVPITLTIDPSHLDETPDEFTALRQGLFNRYYLSEHSGVITAQNASFARLRIAHLANASGVSVYIDGRLVESALLASQVGNWNMRASGSHIITILPKGTLLGDVAPLIEQTLELNADVDSTITIVGEAGSLNLHVIEADRIDPAEAVVQFFNGNSSGAVDIEIDGTIVESGLGYLGATQPQRLSVKAHSIIFYRAGTQEIIAMQAVKPLDGQNLLVGVAQSHYNCIGGSCNPAQLGFAKAAYNERVPNINLHVPFQIFPKSASQASVTTTSIATVAGQTAISIGLNNTGARNQALSPRGAQTPLVAAFELAETSAAIDGLTGSARAADLEYVGITSSYSNTSSVNSTALFFATSSYASWTTPNQVQIRVYLDTTGPTGLPDGLDDYLLLSTSWGAVTNQQPSDVFVTVLYRIQPDGSLVPTTNPPSRYNSLPAPSADPSSVDVAPFNTRVTFQWIAARVIGLSDAQPTFRYRIETRARSIADFSVVIDRVPATGYLDYRIDTAAVAPVNPVAGIPNLQQRPLFLDITGGHVQAQINPIVLAARGEQAVLLLHLHNSPAQQVELVTVKAP